MLGILLPVLWFTVGVVLWFCGYATRNHLNITLNNAMRSDPAMDQRAYIMQAKIGRVGSAMLRLWPVAIGVIAVSIVVGVVTQ